MNDDISVEEVARVLACDFPGKITNQSALIEPRALRTQKAPASAPRGAHVVDLQFKFTQSMSNYRHDIGSITAQSASISA